MTDFERNIMIYAIEMYMENAVMKNYRTCMRLAREGCLSNEDKIDMLSCANHWVVTHNACEDILRSL